VHINTYSRNTDLVFAQGESNVFAQHSWTSASPTCHSVRDQYTFISLCHYPMSLHNQTTLKKAAIVKTD